MSLIVRISIIMKLLFLTGCSVMYEDYEELEVTSGQIKYDILNSPLFRIAENLYPNGYVGLDNVYNHITKKNIGIIENDLNNMINYIAQFHKIAYGQEISAHKIVILNENLPKAQLTEENLIEIDLSVILSIFQGVILNSAHYNKIIFTESDIENFLLNPENKQQQAKILKKLLKEISEVRNHKAYSFKFLDLEALQHQGDKAPFMFFFGAKFKFEDLVNNFWYTTLFLLAHEQAHSILNHFEKAQALKNNTDEDKCRFYFGAEIEADLYATNVIGESGQYQSSYFSNYNSTKGYLAFFNDVFHLAGFTVLRDQCPKASIENRINFAEEAEYFNINGTNEKLSQSISEEFIHAWKE